MKYIEIRIYDYIIFIAQEWPSSFCNKLYFYLPWTQFYPLVSKIVSGCFRYIIQYCHSNFLPYGYRESASQISRPPAPRVKVRKSCTWKCFVPWRICCFCPSLQASHAPGCPVGAYGSTYVPSYAPLGFNCYVISFFGGHWPYGHTFLKIVHLESSYLSFAIMTSDCHPKYQNLTALDALLTDTQASTMDPVIPATGHVSLWATSQWHLLRVTQSAEGAPSVPPRRVQWPLGVKVGWKPIPCTACHISRYSMQFHIIFLHVQCVIINPWLNHMSHGSWPRHFWQQAEPEASLQRTSVQSFSDPLKVLAFKYRMMNIWVTQSEPTLTWLLPQQSMASPSISSHRSMRPGRVRRASNSFAGRREVAQMASPIDDLGCQDIQGE